MAFSPSEHRKFTERNILFGERGAKKRRGELAGFASILQELRNKGLLDVASILQELRNKGLLDVAESGQEFRRPEQEARIAGMQAETEGTRLGTEGQRFFQGLTREFAPSFMRQYLGRPEPESRANVFFPERIAPLRPKADLSPPRSGYTGSWEPEIPSVLPFTPRKRRKKEKERAARPFGISY